MKSRASIHLLLILLIAVVCALGHYTIYYGALIRGYETSWMVAGRNLFLFFVFMIFILAFTRFTRFAGNYTMLTTAILLFSIGMVGQYRVFSDPEYSPNGKAEAREAKIETLQLRYIKENYSAEKKRMMGLEATPPTPVDLSKEKPRPSKLGLTDVLFSVETRNLSMAFFCFIAAYLLFKRDRVLDLLQGNGFIMVLLTVPPLLVAAVTSEGGKLAGMTPWEPSKIPFLLGFAAILAALYRNLAKTYWGLPRTRDIVPLIAMAVIPFIPFFALKDFGQMLVFASVYTAMYLIAVKRLPQRAVFVGSVLTFVLILLLAALPTRMQLKVPLFSSIAEPVKSFLPGRIHQRFYLWFDALNPPPPDTKWWHEDLLTFYIREYSDEIQEKLPDSKAVYDDYKKNKKLIDCTGATKSTQTTPKVELCKKVDNEILNVWIDNSKNEDEAVDEKENTAQAAEEQPQEGTPEDLQTASNKADIEDEKEAVERLKSINEEAWFADDAMQASRATFGLSTGGTSGRGLGLGFPELIPVADSDYIYSALGEETGLFGGMIIIFALIVFVNAGVRTALDARDMFTKLCAAGLSAFIGFQGLVNIGGITRALPMTGIALPFVSHGSFSLLTSFAMLGLLLAISHRNGLEHQRELAAAKAEAQNQPQ